jgi:hypothetical protein
VEVYDPQQKKILHNWEREVVEEGHWAKPMMIFVDGNKEIQLCKESNEAHVHTSVCTLLLKATLENSSNRGGSSTKERHKMGRNITFLCAVMVVLIGENKGRFNTRRWKCLL